MSNIKTDFDKSIAALKLAKVALLEQQQVIDDLHVKLAALEGQEPVAWVRCHPDGVLTTELLADAAIEPVRKKSGSWVALYAGARE